MNNLRRKLVLLCVVIAFTSCSKENSIETSNNVSDYYIMSDKAPQRYWKPASCIIYDQNGKEIKGTMCASSVYATEACPKWKECTPLAAPIDKNFSHFSAQEIEQWENGENIFKFESEYYIQKYDFFMSLYESEMCSHPDTIIRGLISIGL
jgi:hypothetical protein